MQRSLLSKLAKMHLRPYGEKKEWERQSKHCTWKAAERKEGASPWRRQHLRGQHRYGCCLKACRRQSFLENLNTIVLLHKQGDNGDLRKHSIYRQLVCCLQSFDQNKWGYKKSSLRQNFVKFDSVEILTNNLLVPAEIEVAETKKKGENQSMPKKVSIKYKREYNWEESMQIRS